MYSIEQIQGFLSLYGFPAQYQWVIPIALIVAGYLFMFFGKKSWKYSVGAAGLAAGYVLAIRYVVPYTSGYIPDYVIELGLAVLTGAVLSVLVRWAISGGIGYLGYDIAIKQTFFHVSFWYEIVIGILAFGIAFAVYNKISVLIAGLLGMIAMFFGLSSYVPMQFAAIGSALVLLLGMWYQVGKFKPKKKAKVEVKQNEVAS